MLNVYIDIETLPTPRQDIIESLCADVGPPANYKSADAIEKWWRENGEAAKAKAVSKTALDGTWGEVCCIGFAVDDDEPAVLVRTDTEENLLRLWTDSMYARFQASMRSGSFLDSSVTWIGHNVKGFDLRFIWQRCCINGVHLPFQLPVGKPDYSRGPKVFDTMEEWAGYRDYVSQADLELAFGLTRTDPLKLGGEEVFAAYLDGRMHDIAAHCFEDVRLLRELHKRMAA